MPDNDKLRESDVDAVATALANRGVRADQYNRIMKPLQAALQSQRLVKSAPPPSAGPERVGGNKARPPATARQQQE